MESNIVDILAAQALDEYDDQVGDSAKRLLIGCGKGYGVTSSGGGLFRRAVVRSEALQHELADEFLVCANPSRQAELDEQGRKSGVSYPQSTAMLEEMLVPLRELYKKKSPWGTLSVNTAYLLSVLIAPKPGSSKRTRCLDPYEVEKLYAEHSARLKINANSDKSWRWGCTAVVWEVTTQLVTQHGSPYFTPDECEETWTAAVALAVLEATVTGPKGRTRKEGDLGRFFHPPQPDTELPRDSECSLKQNYPTSVAVSISLDGVEMGTVDDTYSERGAATYRGQCTAYFSEFVRALASASDRNEPKARAVTQLVQERTEQRYKAVVPAASKEKAPAEIAKKAENLLTLDRRGRTILLALGLDFGTKELRSEQELADWRLKAIEAEINNEGWSDRDGRQLPKPFKKKHRHSVGHHLDACKDRFEKDWYKFRALGGCYVASGYGRSGFTKNDAHRLWYTTLARDVFVSMAPITSRPVTALQVAEIMGQAVDRLGCDIFSKDETTKSLAPWRITAVVMETIVQVVREFGSPFVEEKAAKDLWLEMLAASYKLSATKDYSGGKKRKATRLAWNTHSFVRAEARLVELAASKGDPLAQEVVARSKDLVLYDKPTRKTSKKKSGAK